MSEGPLVVLLVEDNPGDVLLLTEAIEGAGSVVQMHVARDGEEAMEFLARKGRQADAPRPDVIVLDLNLPVKSGREVLDELRADRALNNLPVAVLTSSRRESDVCHNYPNGCCRYFVKTGDFDEMIRIVKQVEQFALSARRDAGCPGSVR